MKLVFENIDFWGTYELNSAEKWPKSPKLLKIPIFREDLRQSLNLSSVEFNNYLQSLQQRYLVTKIKSDKILFDLSPVFREYVKIFETN